MEPAFDSLLHWLASHPHWILLATGLMAFLESLALVGVIVPGVALLFAIAALAGSTGIPLSDLLLAGFIGALLGDGCSYLLGYHYQQGIRRLPPFSSHPDWISRAEAFFRRYGVAGIVVGRFVGPVRPIMPLVAGLMKMRPAQFFSVNLLSALAWSPFYLMPGYVVGRSTDGPHALTTQHLLFLGGILAIGWLLGLLAFHLHQNVHRRRNKRQWALGLAISFALSLILLGWAVDQGLLQSINTAASQWAFGLRHLWLDKALISFTILGEYQPMILWASLITLALLLQRNTWAALLWTGFCVLGLVLMEGAKASFAIDRPALVTTPPGSLAFPSGHTAMMAIFVGLLASLLLPSVDARRHRLILSAAGILIIAAAATRLYLGVHWLSDLLGGLLLGGLVISLFYLCVLWRPFRLVRPRPLLAATALAVLINIPLFVLPHLGAWTARYQALP